MAAYDLVVIGNGSAGDNIARTLARQGKQVAVVERARLGGECLNDGCIPSKALVSLAASAARDGLSWDDVIARVHSVQLLVRGNDPDGGMNADGIDLYRANARVKAPGVVLAGSDVLEAPEIVVATGTSPAIPPVPGLADAKPITNREVFHLPALPPRIAVIGAGPIGLELGQALHRLGSSVTMFEALPAIASTEDEQVSLELTRLLQAEGIRLVTDADLQSVVRDEGGKVVVTTAAGRQVFDEVLVAAGRAPVIPDGLEELGVERDRRGFISIDGCGRTSVDTVWAAGDITGKFQFTHYAAYQAHHIAKHLGGGACAPIPDTIVPWAVFTDPEIGHVGMTEAEARAAGYEVRVGVLKAGELDWFRTVGRPAGFAKVIANAADGRLLGVHFLCANGSTLAGEASLALTHGLTARDVASTIHPYPTAGELFRWACASAV